MSREMLPTHEESVALRMVGIVRRRLLVALVAFATVIAGAVAFALYLPDLYQAHATVLIERPLGDTVRPSASDNLENRLYAIQSTILSRDRLTELIERFNLYPELRQKGSQDEVLTQAREDIQWKPNGPEQVSGRNKTVTFTLTYTGDDRRHVADVANTVAGFYASYNGQMRASEAQSATAYYKTQLDAARARANDAQVKLTSFVAANQSQLPQSAGVGAATYARLSDELTRLKTEQGRIKTLKDRLEEDLLADQRALATSDAAAGVQADTPGFEPSKELRDLGEQLSKAREAVATMEQKGYAAGHPDLAAARTQVSRLEQEIDALRAKELAEHKAREEAAKQTAASDAAGKTPVTRTMPRTQRTINDYNVELARLAEQEKRIQDQMMTMMQRFDAAPAVQNQYALLQREYESAKEAYDQAQRSYEQAKQNEAVETSGQAERFTILEAAIPPEGPSAPNRPRLLIMGFLLALAAAAAAVVAREQFDTSFHSVDEVREFTSIPVIASIPQIGKAPRRGYARLALGTVSAVAAIVLVGTLSAYLANGNETLVRLLNRAG
jgi:polysaccharide chain length determinant protein (PEP-CTERM system associated)